MGRLRENILDINISLSTSSNVEGVDWSYQQESEVSLDVNKTVRCTELREE